MNLTKAVLAVCILVTLALVAAWDIAVMATGKPEYSVSSITQSWSKENPVLPLIVGVVVGHLFWPIK